MDTLEKTVSCGIVPVVVLDDAAQAIPTARALLAGGINVMEITFRTAAAKESIRLVSENVPEMTVGAGTVLSIEQLEDAVNAGAKFIVCPGSDKELIAATLEKGLPVIPGVVTPSEIMMGLKLGLKVFKFFPAEAYGGLKTIKAYGREEVFLQRFHDKSDAAADANYNADAFGSITGPSVNFVSNLSLAMVSLFGALMYMAGGVSLGNISSFVLYSRKFSGPINEFANLISELQSALAAAERVLALIDAEPEQPDAPDAVPVEHCQGQISLRDVCFGYEPGREILHHISAEVQPGRVIAIVGATGCGKTTLINLLMRFYDVTSGEILLDGRDIRTYQRQSLRRQYTMVLQDTWLFEGTIYDNIAYGAQGVTREDVIAAAKAAHIHETILSLPQGYDTLLTGDGGNISKGQKQLLTIARAMLLKSPMLILDEATSNVDTQTEKVIADAMLALMRGRTCFVIAHRLSTIVGADRILCMQDGSIVESGTHRELLQRNSVYASIYRAQFEDGV